MLRVIFTKNEYVSVHGEGENHEVRSTQHHKSESESVKKGDVMSLVKFEAISAPEMASVLTTESVEGMELKPETAFSS
jgi:molybdopterin-binding protein